MIVLNRLRKTAVAALSVLVFSGLTAWGAPDRTFNTSPTQATEVRLLIQMLEQAHYNRGTVKPGDYSEVIPSYMAQWDPQHFFFLSSDKDEFIRQYGQKIYYNSAYLGNIDPAYNIFAVYETRTKERIAWILDQLSKDIDLKTNDQYAFDRSKAEWPATKQEADDIWTKRLKFELIAEMLGKKDAEKAKEAVKKRYERYLKNISETESRDLAEAYLNSIAELYDPHSSYFSAETFEDFSIQMKLQLVGIGALLGLEDDYCIVKEIVPGGPTDLGKKLKPNDKILSVAQEGGEPVEIVGMKLRKIVDMIRGAKGSTVTLVIEPADAADISARKTVQITRDVVKLNSARARAGVFQVPGSDGVTRSLGVITLPSFYGPAEEGDTDASDHEKSGTTEDIARLITDLKKEKIEGIVLDLRRNGGGFLTEAINLTGLFIKNGPVVQVKDYAGNIQVDNDQSDAIAYDGPLAVLVDRFSASASEIVTGALQNYGRAIVIGDTSTHGKGSVQTVMEMKNYIPLTTPRLAKTGAAKITVQKYYLPSGSSTQLKGVIPDIVLPSIDDYLPIGEASLPHAMVWDEIPTSFFDGKPIDVKLIEPLREASLERQSKLEEFLYLKRNIDWFKAKQDQKTLSLNIEARQEQKKTDDTFRKEMKAERDVLAKNDFPYKEFRLAPVPPKAEKAKKTPAEGDAESEEDSEDDENDAYAKMDIPLRESLRVLSDTLTLEPGTRIWAKDGSFAQSGQTKKTTNTPIPATN